MLPPATALEISTHKIAEVSIRCETVLHTCKLIAYNKLLSSSLLTMAQQFAQSAGKAEDTEPSPLEGVR